MSATEAKSLMRLMRIGGVSRGAAWLGAGLALVLVTLSGPLAAEPGTAASARATLYEEDAFSSGKNFPGVVVWHAMPIK
jgi:hypothetical protein